MPVTVRPVIAKLPAYQAGKPAPIGPGGTSFKLSSNENPYPPLPGVIEAGEIAIAQMNRYPDAANTLLAEAVAARLSVRPDNLAFGTGSVAVLYHLLQALCEPGDEVIYAWRSFEAYPIAVQVTGATAVPVPLLPGTRHDLDAMLGAITPATKVILLCSPNNPTGPALPHQDVIDFVEAVPDHIAVVLDEAYVEFVTAAGAVRALEVFAEYANVVVLRTFSKAYGLAGLRVGFCVADSVLAAAVRATALPFGVSGAAQAVALASLEAEPALLERVSAIAAERELMVAGLTELSFDVPSAQGNFVWIPARERTPEYAELFAAEGLMIRPYVGGDPGDGIRITVGEPEANALVLLIAAKLPR